MPTRKSDVDSSSIDSLRGASQLHRHLNVCTAIFSDSNERIKSNFSTVYKELPISSRTSKIVSTSEVGCRKRNNASHSTSPGQHRGIEAAKSATCNHDGSLPGPKRHNPPKFSRATRSKVDTTGQASGMRQNWIQTRLYDSNIPPKETVAVKTKPSNRGRKSKLTPRPRCATERPSTECEAIASLIRLLETRPVSQEPQVADLQDTYERLDTAESKYSEISTLKSCKMLRSSPKTRGRPGLDCTRHYYSNIDFSFINSLCFELQILTSKHIMPSRMWRYGINCFLELLLQPLSPPREQILTVIYLAYYMTAWRNETEYIWIMEVWTSISRYRYPNALDKSPLKGSLHQYLPILTRLDAFQQLLFHIKYYCILPQFPQFTLARDSMMIPNDSMLFGTGSWIYCNHSLDSSFRKAPHGKSCGNQHSKGFLSPLAEIFRPLDSCCCTRGWMGLGHFVCISPNPCLLPPRKEDDWTGDSLAKLKGSNPFSNLSELAVKTLKSIPNLSALKDHCMRHLIQVGSTSQDLEYTWTLGAENFRWKQTNVLPPMSTMAQRILLGGPLAHLNAMSPLLGIMLMATGVPASPTGNRDSTHQTQIISRPETQWPWHFAVGVSTLACLSLSWLFNRKREPGIRDYETWFLVAALLHNAEYGYKAFVKERLESSWSAGLAAMFFTSLWTYHDTRRMGTNARQLLILGIATVVLVSDTKISSSMSLTSFAKSFMALLVPCLMGATLFWRAIRTIGDCIVLLN